MNRDDIAQALEDEVIRRDEWYGLDNWSFGEVVNFVADRLSPGYEGTESFIPRAREE